MLDRVPGFPTRNLKTLAVLLLAANPLPAAIIRVGLEGPPCDTNSLTTAISLASATTANDEIRLESGLEWSTAFRLHLTDWNPAVHGALTISGGWESCSDTTPTAGDRALIDASADNTVIEIDTTGANTSQLTLTRILIWSTDSRSILVQGNASLYLIDSGIQYAPGGAISVTDSGFVFLDADSFLTDNGPVAEGGAIHCSGADAELSLRGFIGGNSATSAGGGVFADSGCHVGLVYPARFYQNSATFGGGIHLEGGATLATADGHVSLDHNHADSSGGGLSASGAGTAATLGGAAITFNIAGFSGGGIYAAASAQVTLDGTSSCGAFPFCVGYLAYNELEAGAEDGSAAAVFNGAKLRLLQSVVERNEVADAEPDGSVLHAEGGSATIETESVEVSGNHGADRVFHGLAGATLEIAFTTSAFNWANAGLADGIGVAISGAATDARINTSIFHPVAGFSATSGASFLEVDCLITETTAGLTGGSFVVVADPLYRNVATGDLRPRPGSPALDFCDGVFYTPTQGDLEGRARGHDIPTDPNGSPGPIGGLHDAGAFEIWELFIDGFESGDTGAWSFP